MQKKDTYILSQLLTAGSYSIDIITCTPAELRSIRRLWEEGIITRAEHTQTKVRFVPTQGEASS